MLVFFTFFRHIIGHIDMSITHIYIYMYVCIALMHFKEPKLSNVTYMHIYMCVCVCACVRVCVYHFNALIKRTKAFKCWF